MNYYNEFSAKPAAALRQLIADGLIPMGEVDDRSIKDVRASDLRGFTQCHFFAGIGGWPQALALASWRADRPVWTGSCPCQPFSSAGKQKGGEDHRDLWPVWFNLIRECQPSRIYGEQVASAISHGWLDRVYADMETQGYSCGSAVLPACSVNAPHKRDRLWFVANASSFGRRTGRKDDGQHDRTISDSESQSVIGTIPDTELWGCEWIVCADGKARRIPAVESGICLLAYGVPQRVGLLAAAGNAIVPEVAARFIRATM